MRTLSHSFLFTTTGLIFSFTFASPPLPWKSLKNTALNIPHARADSGLKCWEPIGFGSNLPTTADCLQLAEHLLDTDNLGLFHNGRPINSFTLPVVKNLRSCSVTVSLPDLHTAITSWSSIQNAVLEIAEECSVGQFPRGRSGGVKYIGIVGHVRVTVERLNYLSSYNLTADLHPVSRFSRNLNEKL